MSHTVDRWVDRWRNVGGGLAIFAGTALALLGACAETKQAKQGQSSVYQEAYKAGCDSGFAQASGWTVQTAANKDEGRFAADAEYRRGWDDGYRQCYANRTIAIQSRSGGGGR